MDTKVLHKLSYGMYLICANQGDKLNGQVANTVFQITSEPPTVAVSINKQNLTHEYIAESGAFSVSILSQDTPMQLIGLFGFKCGRDIDKFAETRYIYGQGKTPIVLDYAIGFLEAEVVQRVDAGTHTIFIAKVINAKVINEAEPMTYAYYHQTKKGLAPKTAPTYIAKTELTVKNSEEKYKCSICGYVYDPALGDSEGGIAAGTPFVKLPQEWACPICGAGKDEFVLEE